ncbi:MAG: hypothetical protein HY918_03540 [Candidatus Doudnabacteria bacterium]|nr:hypothetical protein [Candidatus Doudnabacteria bacterium]
MKNIFPIFLLLVLVSSGCNKNQQSVQSGNDSNQTSVKVIESPYKIVVSSQVPTKKLTSPDDVGMFLNTEDPESKVYINNNLGIQINLSKKWELGDIYDKNYIIFIDPADAKINYDENNKKSFAWYTKDQTMQSWLDNSGYTVKYYKDFNAWKEQSGYFWCESMMKCFVNDVAHGVEYKKIDGSQAALVTSEEGDAFTSFILVEHGGFFEFSASLNGFVAASSYPYPSIENSLKFLK